MKTIIFAVISALVCSASATSYAPPASREVASANDKFHLKIDANTNIHEVTGPFGQFIPKWQFCHEVNHADFFVSDDGEKAVVVEWRFVGVQSLDEPAVVVYSRHGARRMYSYRELSNPRTLKPKEIGPVGQHWRVWRETATNKDNTITIVAEGRGGCSIDLKSGVMRWIPTRENLNEK